jgi:hypothetical protein
MPLAERTHPWEYVILEMRPVEQQDTETVGPKQIFHNIFALFILSSKKGLDWTQWNSSAEIGLDSEKICTRVCDPTTRSTLQ